jgi:hypothetical protein
VLRRVCANSPSDALSPSICVRQTQSFIHALISDVLRVHGEGALDYLEFKSCTDVVKGVVATVVQYSLDSMGEDGGE